MTALVCAIKPLCAWNIEEAATTCRERCGGQGYLSCNRFGSILGFAHAGMTAEGDNRCDDFAAWLWGGKAGAGRRGWEEGTASTERLQVTVAFYCDWETVTACVAGFFMLI